MKNILIIDVDSERDPQIKISKGDESAPTTGEEAKAMVDMDLTTLIETTILLVQVSHDNGYLEKNSVFDKLIKKLTEAKV